TLSDENQRTTIRMMDGQQRLVLETGDGISTAQFSYGPFNQLENESVSDDSDYTSITYDIRGRTTSVSKQRTGTRGMSYNAFGDVISTYKENADGTQTDVLSYGRDALGRLTGVTGAGVNRTLYWDHNVPGYQGTV